MSFLSARQATGRRSRRTTSSPHSPITCSAKYRRSSESLCSLGSQGIAPRRAAPNVAATASASPRVAMSTSITGMIAPASTATSPTTAGQSHPRSAPMPSAASSEWRHSRPCTHSGIRALPRKRLRSDSARLVEVVEVEAPAIRGRSARARSAAFGAPPRGGTRPGTRGRRVPAARRRRASRRGS